MRVRCCEPYPLKWLNSWENCKNRNNIWTETISWTVHCRHMFSMHGCIILNIHLGRVLILHRPECGVHIHVWLAKTNLNINLSVCTGTLTRLSQVPVLSEESGTKITESPIASSTHQRDEGNPHTIWFALQNVFVQLGFGRGGVASEAMAIAMSMPTTQLVSC